MQVVQWPPGVQLRPSLEPLLHSCQKDFTKDGAEDATEELV